MDTMVEPKSSLSMMALRSKQDLLDFLRECRSSHKEWADYLKTTDNKEMTVLVGDLDHHNRCVDYFDELILYMHLTTTTSK